MPRAVPPAMPRAVPAAMIVSASYRSDIPAFYGAWFLNRLEAGFCRVVNPYGGQVHEIALTPEAVAGFVFWTRNPGPFRAALAEVARRGFPFVVQITATGYPRALEASVLAPERIVALVEDIHASYGPRAAVWRYDPVLITSATPPAWHRRNFTARARVCRQGRRGGVLLHPDLRENPEQPDPRRQKPRFRLGRSGRR